MSTEHELLRDRALVLLDELCGVAEDCAQVFAEDDASMRAMGVADILEMLEQSCYDVLAMADNAPASSPLFAVSREKAAERILTGSLKTFSKFAFVAVLEDCEIAGRVVLHLQSVDGLHESILSLGKRIFEFDEFDPAFLLFKVQDCLYQVKTVLDAAASSATTTTTTTTTTSASL